MNNTDQQTQLATQLWQTTIAKAAGFPKTPFDEATPYWQAVCITAAHTALEFCQKEAEIDVHVERITSEVSLPQYAHPGDAGMDVFSQESLTLHPSESALVPTGLKVAVPAGYELQVRPKSGLALKRGITVLNSPGTIDSGYRGEVGVILIHHGKTPYRIEKQTKIAQLVLCPVARARLVEETLTDSTSRGAGGFGSTGTTRSQDICYYSSGDTADLKVHVMR